MTRKSNRSKSYYVLSKTRQNRQKDLGVYSNWTECNNVVCGVSGAIYQGTKTLDEAIDLFKVRNLVSPIVYHKGNKYTTSGFRQSVLKNSIDESRPEDENKHLDSTFETHVRLHDLDELEHGLEGLDEQTPPWENFNKDWMLMSPMTPPQSPRCVHYTTSTIS